MFNYEIAYAPFLLTAMNNNIQSYFISLSLLFISTVSSIAQPTFTLNGSTILISDNCYRLTSGQMGNDVGSMWGEYKVDLKNSLEFHFAVNFGCAKAVGEGLAFVLHSSRDAQASLGCGQNALGFGKKINCNNAIYPSFAVELDTRYTPTDKDLTRPHLALVQDGNIMNPLFNPVTMTDQAKSILDCEYHNIRVLWTPSKDEIQVYVDNILRIKQTVDLRHKVFGGQSEVYFGFTASSSSQAAAQMLCIQNVIEEVDENVLRKLNFEQGVGIFLNPVREKVTVDVRFEQDDYVQMQLFDSSGKVIYEVPSHLVRQNQYHVNMPGLPTGVYYITVTNGTERVSKKIVHIATMRA